MTERPASVQRVAECAARLGLAVRIVEMPGSTRTAEEAASACGTTVAQIVKSLVFAGASTGRPYLLLMSGRNRVDEAGFAVHVGEALRRPDAAFVRDLTGYAIGGIPPIGHPVPVATFMDADLMTFATVWAAAGTPKAVFEVDPRELARAAGATVVRMG